MIPPVWLKDAQARISPFTRITPLTHDQENELYIKWENHQITGSFKVRGALNKILSLQTREIEQGIVAASAGNHGQGVALAANMLGIRAIIYAPEHAVPSKVIAMRNLGAEVRLVPGGYGEAEKAGIDFALRGGAIWVSPYNDGQVIAGQGTLALEVLKQLPDATQFTWLVPVGGGGLVAGIGAALKQEQELTNVGLAPQVVGVQSRASPFFYNIFRNGTQDGVQELPSLADGLSGPVESDSLTIPLVHKYVDNLILVSEEEIKSAIRFSWQHYGERIEGSAAVTLAAAISGQVLSRPALIIISGGNIEPESHEKIVKDPIA